MVSSCDVLSVSRSSSLYLYVSLSLAPHPRVQYSVRGTRVVNTEKSKAKKKAPTKQASSTWSSPGGWDDFTRGCGRQEDESMSHFCGRILGCQLDPPRARAAERTPLLASEHVDEEEDHMEDPVVWTLAPSTQQEDRAVMRLRCQPLERLSALLAAERGDHDHDQAEEGEAAVDSVHSNAFAVYQGAFRRALAACPKLLDTADANERRWRLHWSPELQVCACSACNASSACVCSRVQAFDPLSDIVRVVVAEAADIAADIAALQSELLLTQDPHDALADSDDDNVRPWLESKGYSRHVITRLETHGFERLSFLALLTPNIVEELKIGHMLEGHAASQRLLQDVRSCKGRTPKAPAVCGACMHA